MNEISSAFLRSELSYRADRIKNGNGKSRRRSSGRNPSVRRTTRTTR